MNNEKNNFSRFLQEKIEEKSPSGGGVNWFALQLSETYGSEVKTANVYKWLSGGTAREVPSKYLKPKSFGESNYDPISKALKLTEAERIEMFDAFFTSYSYTESDREALFDLLSHKALEGVATDKTFMAFYDKADSPQKTFIKLVNAFLDYNGCERLKTREQTETQFPEPIKKITVVATEYGLLTKLDSLISLIVCFNKSGFDVKTVLVFDKEKKPSSIKINVLQKTLPLFYASTVMNVYEGKTEICSIDVSDVTSCTDYVILGDENGDFGYQFFDKANKYVSWNPDSLASVIAAERMKRYAEARAPFRKAERLDFDNVKALITNNIDMGEGLFPNKKPHTYVLNNSKTGCETTDSTSYIGIKSSFGDSWVKYALCIDKTDEITLVPYYMSSFSFSDKTVTNDVKPEYSIKIVDGDLGSLAEKYLKFLNSISEKSYDDGDGI